MEVRPTFEREQKRSAARVQNVDHCFGVRKHFAVSGCGNATFSADRPRARLRPIRGLCLRLPRSVPKPHWLGNEQDQPPFWRRRFCGLSCWSDLHFSTDCSQSVGAILMTATCCLSWSLSFAFSPECAIYVAT